MSTILLVLAATALAADPTVEELLNATDDVMRGESSVGVIEMHVKTARYERTMAMKSWSQGTEKTLIIIEEPAKDKGVATLKVGDNIWNYLPKVDRTMKVPSGMMSGSWMGSHFSNDDLVKENRLSEEFTWTDPTKNADNNWVITLTPQPDAAIVWGAVVVTVSDNLMPVKIEYQEEDGTLARTLAYSEVKDLGGRTVPTVMTLTPADKPEEFTKITYRELDFDADVPESMFSLQSLKR
ncbi:MAG: outer membrane lipoprotein-sorting protein [Rhodobacterales bacterium]|nr:outer membrane lipoprotein-sorting protein [Rhodobacterales bacterium]